MRKLLVLIMVLPSLAAALTRGQTQFQSLPHSLQHELWRYNMAKFIERYNAAQTPEELGREINSLLPGQNDWLPVAKKVKEWPVLRLNGDALEILGREGRVIIKPEDFSRGTLNINGTSFHYIQGPTLLVQLRQTFARPAKTSRLENLMELILPRAHAINPGIFLGLVENNSAMLNMGLAAETGGALSGAAAGFSAVTVGALATGVAVTGFAGYCALSAQSAGDGHRWNEFANCTTKPLSWLGINPRDRLYTQSVRCDGNSQITSVAKSSTNRLEYRTFKIKNGVLQSAEVKGQYDEGQVSAGFNSAGTQAVSGSIATSPNGPSRPLDATADADKLKDLSGLTAEFQYYQSLCRDPKALAQFNENAGKTGGEYHAPDVPMSGAVK